MTSPHPFWTYSHETLQFTLGGAAAAAAPAPGAHATHRATVLRALARSGKTGVLLLGLGDGALVTHLAATIAPHASLTVCAAHMPTAQAVVAMRPQWWSLHSPVRMIADASPWAHAVLLFRHGPSPRDVATMLHPGMQSGPEREPMRLLQRLLAMGQSAAEPRPAGGTLPAAAPPISFFAILHPDEPDLADFAAHLPPWLAEVILIWDAPATPGQAAGLPWPTGVPVRHVARPLGRDFAAQRNAALKLCRGAWVITLDGDERLAQETWNLLPTLAARSDMDGCYMPRQTLYPDAAHCMVGHGLWPDPQIRLFRRVPQAHWHRPVHEQLVGISGPVALMLDDAVFHRSLLRKTPQSLRAKLNTFDSASGGSVRHRLNADYPNLPCTFFAPPPGPARFVLLSGDLA